MLTRIYILLIIALAESGCFYESGDRYKSTELPSDGREQLERDKRELVRIEDLNIGNGSLASWNRKISVDMDVRYANGEVVYKGPAFAIIGFYGLPETGISDKGHIGSNQIGIRLGLSGMAVGGHRRINVNRRLVCTDLPDDAAVGARCDLIGYALKTPVKKEDLIVEVTLKKACIPVKLEANIWYIGVNIDIRCREEDTPRLDPTLPIWHVY